MERVIWLRGLASELGLQQDVIMCWDSKNAINLMQEDLTYWQDATSLVKLSRENITVNKIFIMDILTKLVLVPKFKHCLDLIGIYSLWLLIEALMDMNKFFFWVLIHLKQRWRYANVALNCSHVTEVEWDLNYYPSGF